MLSWIWQTREKCPRHALCYVHSIVNWLIDSIRWTWLTISFLAFIAAECLAVYYLYKFLGWM